MINEVIYKGLLLTSSCRYYNVKVGNTCSLCEDNKTSTLTLTYTPGSTNESLSKFLGIKKIGRTQDIESTNNPVRFKEVIVCLNGLGLKKLTSDSHVINVVCVCDSESRVIQTYDYTTIVVSDKDKDNPDFIQYLFYSGNLLYLKPYGPKPKNWTIKNFPKILVKDKDLNLTSDSDFIYTLRKRHDDYVIRAIDYQDQFILELRRILEDYGIELVRWNKEKTLQNTSYISYIFSQTPSRIHHPNTDDIDDKVMSHRLPVDFTLRTPDMVMFFDFKNKYNNVDLLTNFCEFKTTDKYGNRWTAAIKWDNITEDFNHQYQQDDNSNFSYQCQFRCELYFYEVLDDKFEFLEEIIYNIEANEGRKDNSSSCSCCDDNVEL